MANNLSSQARGICLAAILLAATGWPTSVLTAARGKAPQAKPRRIPAFPGAEGYGSLTPGGRGGKVIAVTNLNASGPGSFRAACDAKGPRIVVFKASGTIDTDLRIRNDYITIAGQTAPGDGVTIKGTLGIGANDVIIRYLRVRAEGRGDAVGSRYKKNIILDHVTASWSSDEVMSIYHCENVTIQWCMITEACSKSHKFGGIWGSNYSTYHHNLIAHNASRNPRWASGCGNNDYRNNVVYNWGYNSCYGAEARQPGKPRFAFANVNMIANYYKPGPGTQAKVRSRIADPSSRSGDADAGKWWVSENVVEGSPSVTADNWKGVTKTTPAYRLKKPWPAMPITQQTAEEAYKAVLERAGCSLPKRDVIDTRIIDEVRKGSASRGKNGLVDSPTDAGGWPKLATGAAPTDTDQDGMPDGWEIKYGFDPKKVGDGAQDRDKDGYTNVEEYLNGTDPRVFVDYTKPENNTNTLR